MSIGRVASLVCLCGLAAKLLWLGQQTAPATFTPPYGAVFATVAAMAGIALVLFRLTGRTALALALAVNLMGTAVGLIDLWHFRFYGDLASISEVWELRQILTVFASVRSVVHASDFLLFADAVFVALIGFRRSIQTYWNDDRAARRRANAACVAVAVVCSAAVGVILWRDPAETVVYQFQRQDLAAAAGLAGYHLYDVAVTLAFPIRGRLASHGEDAQAIANLITDRRRNELPSHLLGIARGANVILISAESLQTFAIGMNVNGQSLTPNLDAFARDSMYFSEFYDQTRMGTTSDAEFMALNSLLPLSSGSVATRYEANDFITLPQALRAEGYTTISACGEPPSFWNMRQIHARYGFDNSLFLPELGPGPWVGAGLDDKIFVARMAAVLEKTRTPSLAFLLSSSNHDPFELPAALRHVSPAPLAGTRAGNYVQSVHYFDEAFGEFIAALRASGVLDRSVIVMYGDHQSWMSDADLQRLWLLTGHHQAASAVQLWTFRHKVPLFIRLPGGAESGPSSVTGGHLDVAPTVLSLLGLKSSALPWFGHDLMAPHRSFVVFRDGAFTDGHTTAVPVGGRLDCRARDDSEVPCAYLEPEREEAAGLIDASDRMIAGNLARRVSERLLTAPAIAPAVPPRFLVVAHRGNSIAYPESTLASLNSAFDLGADVAEVDVRLSADGVPMIFHDEVLDRTTNGHGVFEAHSAAELLQLDAGSWMNPRFKGLRIPTLEQALRVAKGRGTLYLDLKVDGLAKPVAAAFARAGVPADTALVAGWTAAQRAEFHRDMPTARVLTLDGPPVVWGADLFRIIREAGLWGFEFDAADLSPSFVGDAVRHGVPVFAYTINDESTMRRAIEMGVTGIESDDPALLIKTAVRLGVR